MTHNSDTVKNENPFLNPRVVGGILEQQIERDALSLRKAVTKVLNDYSIGMDIALHYMATLQPLEDVVAKGRNCGADYLESITRFCIEKTVASIPPSTKKPADLTKPHIVGIGSNRHIDTGVIQMPTRKSEEPTQAPLVTESIEPKSPTTVLGNPIPTEIPAIEISDDHKAALDSLRNGNKQGFEDDPLTGKPHEDLIRRQSAIRADVMDEEPVSELDAAFGPKADGPMFDYDAAMTVANMLGKAFPDTTSDYKLHFFREATGLNLVKDATTAEQQIEMFKKLNEGIEHAKNNPVEIAAKTVEISTSATQVPKYTNEPIVPNVQPSIVEVVEPQTKSLSVVPKTEIATVQNMIGFKIPSQEQFGYMQQLAKFVAQSGFYKDVNTEAKAMVIFMKGFAINVEPMTALDGIFVISGRPFVGAKLVKGLLEASGLCQRFDVVGDAKKCTVTCQRKGRPQPNVYTFTWEEATKAGLTNKENYQKWPGQMLRWRAVKQAVDTDFPELGFGLGRDPEEEAELEAA